MAKVVALHTILRGVGADEETVQPHTLFELGSSKDDLVEGVQYRQATDAELGRKPAAAPTPAAVSAAKAD